MKTKIKDCSFKNVAVKKNIDVEMETNVKSNNFSPLFSHSFLNKTVVSVDIAEWLLPTVCQTRPHLLTY